ncbi:MAG: site-specific integrase [Actinomycetota bacterium]|nr:site-specific integrase [Actinomycetota bacterium]
MRGHLRRRADAWELRAYLGRDPVTGRKRYATRTIHGVGKRQAERELAAFVVAAGVRQATAATFGELLERWIATNSPGWSPKTLMETRRFIRCYLGVELTDGAPAMTSFRLDKLGTAQIDTFYALLRSRGGRKGPDGVRKPLSPGTVRRIHAVVRSALGQAVDWGWLPANPAARAKPGKVPRARIIPPAPDDVVALFEAAEAEDPELALFLVLAADTGARRGELSALRRTDFHPDGTVTIARAIVLGADGPVEKDPKNPDSVRTIALSARTAEWLAAHWRRCEERVLSCGTSLATDAFVFAALPDGSRPWRPDTWTHRFVRLRSKLGLDHVRLHDLRHFVVTTLLAAGVPVSQVAGRVGHGGGGATTLKVYGHFLKAQDRAAAELLADLTKREATSAAPGVDGGRVGAKAAE